jgi:acyl dehydratase
MTDKFMVGQSASLTKSFTLEDVLQFSKLSLDINPIHLDLNFASKTMFKKPIVHGYLYGSLISAIIANKLPGPGSIYISQTMNFKRPVFHGEVVTAQVTIEGIKPEKQVLFLSTHCFNADGELVLEGSAVIKLV